MSDKAVLVIDMLNDFSNPKGKLYCETAKEVIPKIKKLISAARLYDIPVFYSNDSHLKDDRELGLWGEHAMKGSWGAEVVSELKPANSSEIVEKRFYSGFTKTNLNKRLKDLGVKTLYITGMHTNICDRHTSYDAFVEGYDLIIVSDATGTFSKQEHASGLEYLRSMYMAKIKTVEEVIKEFKS